MIRDLLIAAALLALVLAVAAIRLRADRRKPRYRFGEITDLSKPGPDVPRALRVMPGFGPLAHLLHREPVVHQTPDHDGPLVTRCCGVHVGLLPPDEPFCSDPDKVTCRGKSGSEGER